MEEPKAQEVDPAQREAARNAWTFGLVAIGLALMIPCSGYVSMLAALPLGLVAAQRARLVLDADRRVDEATEVYARTGRILGMVAAGYSGLFMALILAIILLYVGMFAMMFGAIATLPPPPPPAPYP